MTRTTVRRITVAAAFVLALVFMPIAVFAEGGGVQFSYEKVEIGGTAEWVLIPRPAEELTGKVTAATLKKAWEKLRRSKGSTYGKSTISVSGKPPRAKVTVKIDGAVSKYALIIIAETVYTMTELGVDSVSFPGHASGGVGREDVPFAAYALTVPLWKAVGRFDSDHVHVRMPDGALEPSREIAKRWKRNDSDLRKAVYSYLESDDTYTVTTVAKLLPKLKIPYADQVTPLLESKDARIKMTALEVLEPKRNDTGVLKAVAKLVDDKNEKIAREAATFLGKSKRSEYAVMEQYFLLSRGKSSEKLLAAKKLGDSKDKRTVDALAAALTDMDGRVSKAAAESLAKLDADDAQKKALTTKGVLDAVKLDIARDLASDRSDDAAIAGLVYVANNAPDYEAVGAVEALGKRGGAAARKAVEDFLGADREYLRLAAARTLVAMGDADAITALAKAVKAGENAREMERAGYELLAGQPLSTVLGYTKNNRDSLVQRMAYVAIGERAQAKGPDASAFSVLEQGTKSRDPLIRGAAARAMGTFGDKRAAGVLERLTGDKSASVRADVALGIGYLKDGLMAEQLEKYLGDSSPQVQAAALTSLARRGEAGKWARMQELANSKEPQVRAAALSALARLVSRDDKQGVRDVVSRLSGAVSDGSMEVREVALEELGTFDDEKAVTAIALQTGAEEEKMRIAAVRALGNTGNANATELVTNMLLDPNRNVREAAIHALAELNDPAAKPALKKRAKEEKDEELVALIQTTLKKL